MQEAGEVDVVIVGAGFGGLYALYRLRAAGFSVQGIERGTGVGGTWFWNRYPGACCDIESIDYSYSFSESLQQEWVWSDRYASQPEILRYLEHVADRFGVRPHLRLGTTVVAARFDESRGRWDVTTDDATTVSARWVVMAGGSLSVPTVPRVDGLDTFGGRTVHTADWPADGLDLAGRRVGVIGTGSSGVHVVPLIARQAAHTVVFQRTPNFCVPARNAPVDPEAAARVKADYPRLRAVARRSRNGTQRVAHPESAMSVSAEARRERYEQAWALGGNGIVASFGDLLTNPQANATLVDFLHEKVRSLVDDPATADLLCSQNHPVGAKRLCVGTGYHEAFNRADVTLVDVHRAPIVGFTPTGLRTADATYELDTVVFATGFDAITGAVLRIDVRGRGGRSLREAWAAGPRTHLGVATAGFPNLFLVAGPGTPAVFTNAAAAVEQHVDWIAEHLEFLRRHDLSVTEPTEQAQDAWVDHVGELAARTLLLQAASWYLGANVPGKPRVFMPYVGGLGAYRAECEAVAAAGYQGFVLS